MYMTKMKKNGTYIEIGANHPITASNTYLLDMKLNWKGLLIELDEQYLPMYKDHRPNSVGIIGDATQIDYASYLEEHNFPLNIDYLQIDLDVNNRSTLTTLELFDEKIFDKYKFGLVTFEHDIYTGDFFDTRNISRSIFEKRGYVRVFSDVSVWEHDRWCSFEDWYAHPDIIDKELIQSVVSDAENQEGVHSTDCIRIIKKYNKTILDNSTNNPIRYIAMGLLGDFIHQLSVVNEHFLNTGRKGIVYLTNYGSFRNGREKAYTDTYNIIKSQPYIEDYLLYNDQEYDIDLTKWITSPLLFYINWNKLYKEVYDVNWGSHPWITINKKDERWKDTIFVHTSINRPIDPSILIMSIDKAIFISEDENEYNDFAKRVKPIRYFKPSCFREMVVSIASCKLFIGSLSAPLAIAYASFTKCMTRDQSTIDFRHFYEMQSVWPHFSIIS